MLKANFKITETGGTGHVQLQSSDDSGTTWQDVGSMLTLSQGALTVDDSANISIDTSVFIPGHTYSFRLTDIAGAPISNIFTTHIPSITGYAGGIGSIGFVNTGGDNWTITFYKMLSTVQGTGDTSFVSMDCTAEFYAAHNLTPIDTSTQTGDYTINTGSHGAGVYVLQCGYKLNNGQNLLIRRLTKVDGTGNIVADVQQNGITVNSISGLTINDTIHVVQTGVNYPSDWLASNQTDVTFLTSGTTVDLTPPTDTRFILATVHLDTDHAFTDDYGSDAVIGHSITIS